MLHQKKQTWVLDGFGTSPTKIEGILSWDAHWGHLETEQPGRVRIQDVGLGVQRTHLWQLSSQSTNSGQLAFRCPPVKTQTAPKSYGNPRNPWVALGKDPETVAFP